MKIDFNNIDKKQFLIKEYSIKTEYGSEKVYLINPKTPIINWTDENKIFRSSLWDKEGNLISAGFKKFTNFGEQPEFEPIFLEDFNNIELYEKVDGSCIIVSYWHGSFIIRTRGSIDCLSLGNAPSIWETLKRYDVKRKILREIALTCRKPDGIYDTYNYSYIFEFVSKKRDIVLHYDEDDLYLIGKINHFDYGYHPNEILDIYSETYGWKRPKNYTKYLKDYSISSFDNLARFFYDNSERIEGTVVTIPRKNMIILKKMKTSWYLEHHKLYSKFRSKKIIYRYIIENDLILYPMISEFFDYQSWFDSQKDKIVDKLVTDYDWELSNYITNQLDDCIERLFSNLIKVYLEAVQIYQEQIKDKNLSGSQIAQTIKNIDNHKKIEVFLWALINGTPFRKKSLLNLIM